MTFTLNATINFNSGTTGGQFHYNWYVDNVPVFNQSGNQNGWYDTDAPGQLSVPEQYQYSMPASSGNGATHTAQLIVNAPNFVQSNGASFSLTCNLTVTGVTLSTSGSCWIWGPGLTYTATVTFTPSPGGPVTYSWQRVTNGNADSFNTTGSPRTITPGQTSVTLTLGPFYGFPTIPRPYVGTILVLVTPNMVYSNPVVGPC